MPIDPEYSRKWSICRNFVANVSCSRSPCIFSHSLIDTTRIAALVGELTSASFTSSSTTLPPSSGSTNATQEQIFFIVEYTKYSAQVEDTGGDAEATKWRMKLLGGGRATLEAGEESVSVHPMYPVKGQGKEAGAALSALESRIFGRIALPDLAHTALCRAYVEGSCHSKESCRFSHTLFDTNRIEVLLDEAVAERGYKDYRPTLEVEYVGRRSGPEPASCVWRVTFRCVLGYHQKAAPQPVVVTSASLTTAMRLLERQFAGSSGKPQPTPQSPTPNTTRRSRGNSHRRNSSANPARPSAVHPCSSSNQATPNAADPRRANQQPPSSPRRQPPPSNTTNATNIRSARNGRNTPPPSYEDTLRGNHIPSPSPSDAKRRS